MQYVACALIAAQTSDLTPSAHPDWLPSAAAPTFPSLKGPALPTWSQQELYAISASFRSPRASHLPKQPSNHHTNAHKQPPGRPRAGLLSPVGLGGGRGVGVGRGHVHVLRRADGHALHTEGTKRRVRQTSNVNGWPISNAIGRQNRKSRRLSHGWERDGRTERGGGRERERVAA